MSRYRANTQAAAKRLRRHSKAQEKVQAAAADRANYLARENQMLAHAAALKAFKRDAWREAQQIRQGRSV